MKDNTKEAIEKVRKLLKKEKGISSALKLAIELILTLMMALLNRINLNSSNSSIPPSADPNRKKTSKKKSKRSPGGQKGHNGSNLKPVTNPDEVKKLTIDRRKLPKNKKFTSNGFVSRQVVNIKITKVVVEYRAEILIDEQGNQYIADFPDGVSRPIQYGASVKANATYFSNYQLIPYKRIEEQFANEYHIPLSAGSIFNFNVEAANLLLDFKKIAKKELVDSSLAHADETGINVNGKNIWLHTLCNEKWTWLEPHIKRGTDAMNDIGIIPLFKGVLCHDHWKPYYTYTCVHSLCNGHHLRELTRAFEQDGQKWAMKMHKFLKALNIEVSKTKKEKLSAKKAKLRRKEYRKILAQGDKECPPPKQPASQKRKVKRSKARNLLERLRNYEDDVMRFMENTEVPFTNNLGERDLRMSKVQQKISGCFRSMEGAINFCIIRSYLSTCKKNNISATEALELLFTGKMPDFIQNKLDSILGC